MKVAFCGVMAALSLVVMLLAGVVPVATIALPAVAGCLLIPVVVEAGLAWGFGVYGVCSVLAFLLVPDREAFLFYALFFGYYPVLYAPLGQDSKPGAALWGQAAGVQRGRSAGGAPLCLCAGNPL